MSTLRDEVSKVVVHYGRHGPTGPTSFLQWCLDGNKEIVRAKNLFEQSRELVEQARQVEPNERPIGTFFTYRFINFQWEPLSESGSEGHFVPIRFRCEGMQYDELRRRYTDVNRFSNEALREL